jgi:pSer/pThr/pTyr-binding forkhead associated (FHA) protein
MLAITNPHLVINGGIWDGLTIQLTLHPLVIGRHSTSDVIVEEPTVSRQHAMIVETPRGFAIRDLNSANGTYVNDRNIGAGEHLLKSGDRIRLAGSRIALIVKDGVDETVVVGAHSMDDHRVATATAA